MHPSVDFAAANMQMQTHVNAWRRTGTNADERRQMQMNRDECKANCIWYMGGRNPKMHQDVRRLLKDFRDAQNCFYHYLCM